MVAASAVLRADRTRRLAQASTDLTLKVSLRRLADQYKTRADELEDEEISIDGLGPQRA